MKTEVGQFVCIYDGKWSPAVYPVKAVTGKAVSVKKYLNRLSRVSLVQVKATGTEEHCNQMRQKIEGLRGEKNRRITNAHIWFHKELEKLYIPRSDEKVE